VPTSLGGAKNCSWLTLPCRFHRNTQHTLSVHAIGTCPAFVSRVSFPLSISINKYRRIVKFGNTQQIIRTVKCADGLLLLAKEEKVRQDMIDKLTESGRCYGMEMNVGKKNKIKENFKTTIPRKIMINQKQLEKVESFKYLGSIQMMEDVLVKLNVGLLRLKLHSTRRGLFLPAHWTWNWGRS